jgi:hypothetical protein
MFNRASLLLYLKHSIFCALLASIPLIFFVRDTKFTEIWLLYLGDGLFLFSLFISLILLNKKVGDNASTGYMLMAGHAVTVIAIIIICLITFIVLLIYVPGLLHIGNTYQILKQAPANTVEDKTRGLLFILFVNAVIGTFSAGLFTSIVTAYTIKREQRGDKAEI